MATHAGVRAEQLSGKPRTNEHQEAALEKFSLDHAALGSASISTGIAEASRPV
ncbi:MAG: hypothetical protein ACXV5T_02580 [Halobacteriota archaeon]